jgi:hypothetical protein
MWLISGYSGEILSVSAGLTKVSEQDPGFRQETNE